MWRECMGRFLVWCELFRDAMMWYCRLRAVWRPAAFVFSAEKAVLVEVMGGSGLAELD